MLTVITTFAIPIITAAMCSGVIWANMHQTRKSIANFGARLGDLEEDVAILLDRQGRQRVRRRTKANPVEEPGDE
jgi:hypothetical protein